MAASTKTFHWLTALLILTLIPLGWYANQLPFDTGAELAFKAQLFSYHKTLGVAAFFVALLRILWALTQPKPAPLHPEPPGRDPAGRHRPLVALHRTGRRAR